MSSTYNVEPPPTAKVLLQTTSGDIELEIFAKQTPLTSRNFLQLCIDGYYNDTIFHRLVPGFVLQGGDPTGTGDGGEAIYPGGTFADEFHSRLKFNRRGLLGMANSGGKDDNGSQFFITLGKTEELNSHNTMFGRVVGDTIYNVMKMGDAELVDIPGSERPLYPTKITGAEILVNPFDDVIKREAEPRIEQGPLKTSEKKKGKKKAGKAFLSFAGDGEEDSEEPLLKKAKFNTKLVDSADGHRVHSSKDTDGPRKAKPVRRKASRTPSPPPMIPKIPQSQLPLPDEETPSRSPSITPEPEQISRVSSMLEKTNAQIEELKASMKRTSAPVAKETGRKKSALEQLIPDHAIRGRKRKQGDKDRGASDTRAMDMLNAFRAKLEGASAKEDIPGTGTNAAGLAPAANAGSVQEDDEEGKLCDLHFIAGCQSCQSWNEEGDADETDDVVGKDWMSHSLNFEKDKLGKDLSWKKKTEDDLVVIDPRGKAKEISDEQRSWHKDGGSRRAWDQDRRGGRLPERLAGR